ncbi:MAG: aminotransferase [Firmicutes bacterium]|nr:aminotransferase [Bacillota bacterium]
MEILEKMDTAQLEAIKEKLQVRYDNFKNQNLKLDMSRGKPGADQLDLSMGIFDCMGAECYKALDGTDCRNYGINDGIPEAKKLFADILEVSTDEVIVGGNSSLNMMFDTIAYAMTHGVVGSVVPWSKLPKVKFLCPSPGYDRHFAVCEFFNIDMITIAMKSDGPDMDTVEKLAGEDECIKGIWCVPKYSNPDGITYSDEVVDRLAKMKTAAADFRIFWDNAYVVHHLYEEHDNLKNILSACKEAGNPDRVFMYTSTSKITFPGAGVAAMAASVNNIKHIKKRLAKQTIGPDKLNQLRHVIFLKDLNNISEHMKKHAAILRPKFEIVLDTLEKELGGKNIAWWSKPRGGYFISLNTMPGCAKKVVEKAAEAGVIVTPAGATFPYGKDPEDRNIRIAPTFPPMHELEKAMELICICVQLVSIEKILAERKKWSE